MREAGTVERRVRESNPQGRTTPRRFSRPLPSPIGLTLRTPRTRGARACGSWGTGATSYSLRHHLLVTLVRRGGLGGCCSSGGHTFHIGPLAQPRDVLSHGRPGRLGSGRSFSNTSFPHGACWRTLGSTFERAPSKSLRRRGTSSFFSGRRRGTSSSSTRTRAQFRRDGGTWECRTPRKTCWVGARLYGRVLTYSLV